MTEQDNSRLNLNCRMTDWQASKREREQRRLVQKSCNILVPFALNLQTSKIEGQGNSKPLSVVKPPKLVPCLSIIFKVKNTEVKKSCLRCKSRTGEQSLSAAMGQTTQTFQICWSDSHFPSKHAQHRSGVLECFTSLIAIRVCTLVHVKMPQKNCTQNSTQLHPKIHSSEIEFLWGTFQRSAVTWTRIDGPASFKEGVIIGNLCSLHITFLLKCWYLMRDPY